MDGHQGQGRSDYCKYNFGAHSNSKTVLFVSEKAAALEVVYARLKAAGLAEYA